MLGTMINAGLLLSGSVVGLLFKNLINERLMAMLNSVLGLCVLGIGIKGMVGTENMLCVIVCMVVGAVLGHALRLEERLERSGERLHRRLEAGGKEGGRFTEAFVNSTLLFCVGAMAITGALEAGMNHNYSILISKGVLDGVTAISFAATMGIGVCFAVFPLVVYQGAITLLAAWVGPLLPQAVITEMSAVGGTLIMALGINTLGLGKKRIRVGDMLPAIFLPIAYIPLANWLGGLF